MEDLESQDEYTCLFCLDESAEFHQQRRQRRQHSIPSVKRMNSRSLQTGKEAVYNKQTGLVTPKLHSNDSLLSSVDSKTKPKSTELELNQEKKPRQSEIKISEEHEEDEVDHHQPPKTPNTSQKTHHSSTSNHTHNVPSWSELDDFYQVLYDNIIKHCTQFSGSTDGPRSLTLNDFISRLDSWRTKYANYLEGTEVDENLKVG